jgi:hypothetical protein
MEAASRVRAALNGSRNVGQRFFEIAVGGIEDAAEARKAAQEQLEKIVISE